jgi:hypothetical protein
MNRIILIVAIALLPVLSACFIGKRPHCNCPTTTVLVPEVSKYGTLTNLKDDKGKRLFKKPIQEGFNIRYRVEGGEEHTFFAIGDRVSYLNASFSGYQEKISGAGITTRYGLNITSGFVFDKGFGTLRKIMVIVNLSRENATMYLSEVKNYSDPNLRPLRTIIGVPKKVEPLPTTASLPPVTGEPEKSLTLSAGLDMDTTPTNPNENCWPCLPWPDCDLINLVLDPTKATIICISCEKDVPGLMHTVCLANLEEELAKYKANGCDHSIKFTGISDSRAVFDKPCPPVSPTVANYIAREVAGQVPSETALRELLTLRAGTAIVVITEHKINFAGEVGKYASN